MSSREAHRFERPLWQYAQVPQVSQGIEDDTRTGLRAVDDGAACLVTEYQRRHTPWIVAVPGVHVGAADPDRLDPHQDIALAGFGFGCVAVLGGVNRRINQCLHEILIWR